MENILYIAVTKPLLKHNYYNSEVKDSRNKQKVHTTNTSLLLEQVKEKEQKEQIKMSASTSTLLQEASSLIEASENLSPSKADSKKMQKMQKKLEKSISKAKKKEQAQPEKNKKPHFRKLKKPTFNLFDEYIDEEQVEEQRIENLLNQDNYYNEVIPEDCDVEYRKKRGSMALPITLTVLAIIFTILYLVYKVGSLYFFI